MNFVLIAFILLSFSLILSSLAFFTRVAENKKKLDLSIKVNIQTLNKPDNEGNKIALITIDLSTLGKKRIDIKSVTVSIRGKTKSIENDKNIKSFHHEEFPINIKTYCKFFILNSKNSFIEANSKSSYRHLFLLQKDINIISFIIKVEGVNKIIDVAIASGAFLVTK